MRKYVMVSGDEAAHLCTLCKKLIALRVEKGGPDPVSAIFETIRSKLEDSEGEEPRAWRRIPLIPPELLKEVDVEELSTLLTPTGSAASSNTHGPTLYERTLVTDWNRVLGTLITQDSPDDSQDHEPSKVTDERGHEYGEDK